MARKTLYRIVGAYSRTDAEAMVSAAMDAGWELQGGVSAVATSAGVYFMQALVKEEN